VEAMTGLTAFSCNINELEEIQFAIIFVTKKAQTDTLLPQIAPKLERDVLLWFAYPKKTSKKQIPNSNSNASLCDVLLKFGICF